MNLSFRAVKFLLKKVPEPMRAQAFREVIEENGLETDGFSDHDVLAMFQRLCDLVEELERGGQTTKNFYKWLLTEASDCEKG